jgi:Putative transposase DNA-binding domain
LENSPDPVTSMAACNRRQSLTRDFAFGSRRWQVRMSGLPFGAAWPEAKAARWRRVRITEMRAPNIAGIRVEIVQPHYTSQICSRCGCLGTRQGKRFACEACDHEADADRNAADNLRLLGMSVTHPGGPCCSLPKGSTTGCLKAPGFSRGEVYKASEEP